LFFSVFHGRAAAELFKNSVEVSDTAEAAALRNIGDGVGAVAQKRAGLFKAEHVYKILKMYGEILIEQGGEIVIFIVQGIRYPFHRDVCVQVCVNIGDDATDKVAVLLRCVADGIFKAFAAHHIKAGDAEIAFGSAFEKQKFFQGVFHVFAAPEF